MRRAYLQIRNGPLYRREAFAEGLRVAGYTVSDVAPSLRERYDGDLLVIWNRYAHWHAMASAFEQWGGKVLVAENGYIGAGGGTPKFSIAAGVSEGHYIALAVSHHNGGGTWPAGDGERWQRLGVELSPWREDGKHILLCPNRAFGVPGRCMPDDWIRSARLRLEKVTRRPIKLRPHPGNHEPGVPLDDDLRDCWCVVIWSSSAGVHALVKGIPVVCEAPYWILKGATGGDVNNPAMPERTPHFERLAWAQWTVAEIRRGDPFFLI